MRAWVVLMAVAAVAAGCGRLRFDTGDDVAGGPDGAPMVWWDTGYGARIRLDLDRFAPAEAIADMPVLVVLDASRFERAGARPDLADLRFVAADGAVLDHELEPVIAGAAIIAWVRVPAIAAGEKPSIWLYWGNAQATPRPGMVWADTYAGVWHMTDGADASAAGNDAVATGTAPAAGQIGAALDFPAASNANLRIADAPSLHWTSDAITISGWMRLRTYQQIYSVIVARQLAAGGPWNDFFLGVGSMHLHGQMGGTNQINGADQPLDTWIHYALAYDGTTMQAYVDGAPAGMKAKSDGLGSAARPIYIGADSNGGAGPDTDFVNGLIDEVRIESVARSSAWIAADHVSMSDAWITYGPVELVP